MVEDAKQSLDQLIKRLKKIYFIFRLTSFLVSLSFFIFAAIAGFGIRWVNIAFAALLVIYQILDYFVISRKGKKILRKGYRYVRLFVKMISLGMTIYGIVEASIEATPARIIFVSFMALFWLLQVFFEITLIMFERLKKRFVRDIKKHINEYLDAYQKNLELNQNKDNEIIDVESKEKNN